MKASPKYMQLFLEEARALLQDAETCLAALWRNSASADVTHLHRTWHSLKGMAAALELTPLVRLAHAAEERLPTPQHPTSTRQHYQTLQGEALAAATSYLTSLQDNDDPQDLAEIIKKLESPLEEVKSIPSRSIRSRIAMPSASRVPVTELDALLGEVVDLESRLANPDSSQLPDGGKPESNAELRHGLGRIHQRLEGLRHISFATIVPALEQLVQGDAARLSLQVRLDIAGSSQALERGTLELLAEILPHILRNALAHGIEKPSVRLQAGKEAFGCINLRVESRRRHVAVIVEDDGQGVDESSLPQHPPSPGQGKGPGEDLAPLLCRPGWSTSRETTEVSGRGVGLDAVFERLAAAGGSLNIYRRRTQGLKVKIRVPATLSVTRCLVARLGSFHMAIPLHGLHGLEAIAAGSAPASAALERLLAGDTPPPAGEPALELSLKGPEGDIYRFYVHQILGRLDTVTRQLPGIEGPGAMLGTALWQGRIPVVVLDPAGLCKMLPRERHGAADSPDDLPRDACPVAG